MIVPGTLISGRKSKNHRASPQACPMILYQVILVIPDLYIPMEGSLRSCPAVVEAHPAGIVGEEQDQPVIFHCGSIHFG